MSLRSLEQAPCSLGCEGVPSGESWPQQETEEKSKTSRARSQARARLGVA